MHKPYLLAALAALISSSVSAQDAQAITAVQNRLSVFQTAQNLCKYLYLSNDGLAANLVKATSDSLSEVCECAAMLTVAGKTDEQIAALVAAKNMTEVVQSDVKITR